MATAAYNAFIEKPDKEAVILLEVSPRQSLKGWSLVSGRTNTYSRVFENFVREDVIQGGLYRDLTGVSVGSGIAGATNSVVEILQLDERGSIALVEANDSSWYYDEKPLGTTSTLYVHTPTSEDPDALDSKAIATFRVHLSTIPKTFDDIYYEPRITPDSLPDIHEETEDLFFGEVKKVSQGEIGMNNADGLFDSLSVNWAWKNSTVKMYLGGDDLDHTPGGGGDYEVVGSFEVEDVAPHTDETVLFVRDVHKFLAKQLPITPLQRGLPNELKFNQLPPEAEGTLLPIIYGSCKNVRCHRVYPISVGADTSHTYYMADRKFQSLFSVDAVYNDGVEISGAAWTEDLDSCSLVLNITGLTIGTVTADVKGKPVTSADWETSEDYLKYYGEIVCDLYANVVFEGNPTTAPTVTADEALIDSDAALIADGLAPYPQGLVIEGDDIFSRKSARSFVRELEVGVMGRTVKTIEGKIKPTVWEPGVPVVALSLEAHDIAEFEPENNIETLFSKVFVYGEPRKSDGSWGIVEDLEDLETRFLRLNGQSEERSIFTNLTTEAAAISLAGKVLALSKNPDINVRIVETGLRLMNSTVGDRILVSFDRGPHETGVWQEIPVEIISITKRFAPIPSIEIIANDLRGTASFVGLWAADTASAYASATIEEKARNGYWADDDGRVDPSDIQTEKISTWW